jgi:hypothetical protein
MRLFLAILVLLSLGSARAQDSAAVQDAGFAGALRRPQNAVEADIQKRIDAAIKTHHDSAKDAASVEAAFETFGVGSVRLTGDATVLVDLRPDRVFNEADLPALHDAIVDALRDTRPFDASAQPRVTLYIDGAPAYEAVCKDQESVAKDNSRPLPGQELLVINAAHGVYQHHFRGSTPVWMTQRAAHNGIVEDFLTPVFAARLQRILTANRTDGDRNVRLIRQHFPAPPPPDARRQWLDMAGLYALQRAMPERKDVWAFSCRNPDDIAADPLREKYYDTSSRSRFANAIGADGVIHLHTNADCRALRRGDKRPAKGGACPRGQTVNEAASGMNVFYVPASTVSKTLADLIVCTSKQMVGAAYPAYRINPPAPRTDLAELFLARKASVILEIGFHTNPADAALLKSEAFQQRSMEAVAAAWRKYVNGERCG